MNQYVRTFIQAFQNGSVVKFSLALFLGLVICGATLGVSTPKAHADSTGASVASMIDEVFGPNAWAAKRVAMCESSMNPGATNSMPIGNSHAAGVFQILYPSTWYGTSQAANSPYDARANIIAAHEIFVRDGYSWREWVCQP